MGINRADIRIIGCIWLVISFWLPVSILAAGLEESLINYILAISAFFVMVVGFVSGVGLLLQQRWSAIILIILSWIYAVLFFGYTVFIIAYSASVMIEGKIAAIIGIPFAAVTLVFAVLFLLMRKYLKKIHACLSKETALG